MAIERGMMPEPPRLDNTRVRVVPDPVEVEEVEVEVEVEANAEVPFDANLAEYLDEDYLASLGSELKGKVDDDRASRKDWYRMYKDGLKLLGLKQEEVQDPWPGAASMYHPVLTEACVRFQANAITELFPAKGPVKCKIVGKVTDDIVRKSKRVQEDLNLQITERMPGYRDEMETLTMFLPLAGSCFKKVYYSPEYRTAKSHYIAAEDLIVANGCTSLEDCPRITHRYREYPNEVIKRMMSGEFRTVILPSPEPYEDEVEEAKSDTAGEAIVDDECHTLMEIHTELDLEGFEVKGIVMDDEEKNLEVPYIVTLDYQSGTILSIYRNYQPDDPGYQWNDFFTHYKYLPGFGFYGMGLIHLIGGLTEAATLILRQLVDSGTLANMPSGFKTRDLRTKGDDTPIQPGEWRDVDVTSGALKDNIMPMPYKEPSGVLYQLMQELVNEARNLASVPDLKISDMNAEAPVGTAMAIIERSMKVLSAVQGRMHEAFKKEVRMIADVIRRFYPDEYDFDTEDPNARRSVDYDKRIDVLPVTNPNSATLSQRVVKAQTALQMAQADPQAFDRRRLYRDMMEAIGYDNADDYVPIEDDIKPLDSISENSKLLNGEPVKAFIHQNHDAHIAVHMNLLQDPTIAQLLQQSPQAKLVQGAIMAHVQDHLGFKYRQMIEQQMGVELPPPGEELPPQVEVELSGLVAKASQQLLQANQSAAQQQQIQQKLQDPVVQMQQQEVAIKQQEAERKRMEGERRYLIQMQKMMQDQTQHEDDVKVKIIEAILEAYDNQSDRTVQQIIEGAKAGIAATQKLTGNES